MPNWREILEEIQAFAKSNNPEAPRAVDIVRHKYLEKLHQLTNRNLIAYYSGFLSKPEISQNDINDEDKNGFMAAVHRLDREKGLDLILHTPGGNVAATESIVDYLLKMFDGDIRAIVPQIAMSAGTMIACSCKSILMSEHSNLG
ncbi:MAG: SDH family Clp fold serine proteinase, partial [Candidatus Zixiibacteriota bacterium]